MNEFIYDLIIGIMSESKAAGVPQQPEYSFEYENDYDDSESES